jgi:hypothetical protein
MNIRKNFQAAILMLAVLFGTSILVGSYARHKPVVSFPVTSTNTNVYAGLAAPHIFSADDAEPGSVAEIVVNAQELAEVGELVRFDVSNSVAESFKWLLVPESVDFEVYDEGKRAVFSARRSGEYMFIVACAYQGTVDVTMHVVTIEGDNPLPPNPDTPVVPKPNEGSLFIDWIPYWCSQAQCLKYETLQVAGSFEGVAAQISAGVLIDVESIIEATANANRQALGDSLVLWLPVLREIQTELKSRAEAGTLTTLEQHATVWREIAKGMRDYAALFDTASQSVTSE